MSGAKLLSYAGVNFARHYTNSPQVQPAATAQGGWGDVALRVCFCLSLW